MTTRPFDEPDEGDEVTARWSRAGSALWRHTMRGVVLLAADSPEPLALLGSAANVWVLLARPMSIADLIAALAASYDVDAAEIADDTRWIVSTLSREGALCRV